MIPNSNSKVFIRYSTQHILIYIYIIYNIYSIYNIILEIYKSKKYIIIIYTYKKIRIKNNNKKKASYTSSFSIYQNLPQAVSFNIIWISSLFRFALRESSLMYNSSSIMLLCQSFSPFILFRIFLSLLLFKENISK